MFPYGRPLNLHGETKSMYPIEFSKADNTLFPLQAFQAPSRCTMDLSSGTCCKGGYPAPISGLPLVSLALKLLAPFFFWQMVSVFRVKRIHSRSVELHHRNADVDIFVGSCCKFLERTRAGPSGPRIGPCMFLQSCRLWVWTPVIGVSTAEENA